MEIVKGILLFLHLLGMAIIIGGYLVNVRSPRVLPGMLHGTYLQVVTGALLFGLTEMQLGNSPDAGATRAGMTIKLLLGVLVLVFFLIGKRQDKAAQAATVGAANEGAKAPSATMAHLGFAAAIVSVLVAVILL